MADEPIDDLLGAYALDAVDEQERRQVEAYLQANPRAREEVEGHREVAAMLGLSAERPPDGLWTRIAAALEEAPPSPGPRLAPIMPMERQRRNRWRSVVGAVAAGAVAVAAAVAITAVVLDDDPAVEVSDPLAEAYGRAWADPDGRRAELVSEEQSFTADAVVLPTGAGYLSANALPELPDTETWQLWGVYGDEDVISLGVLGNDPGIQAFTASDDLQALVITREQAGGVISSTTGAILVGQLA